MNTDKTEHAIKMLKARYPDSQIIAALRVTAGFLDKVRRDTGLVPLTKAELSKVRRLAGLGLSDQAIANQMGLKYEESPAITAAKAEVAKNARALLKAHPMTLGKGRKSSTPGGIIATLIKRQHAEGSSYEQIATLLNPDRDSDGITAYACKAVVEYGETLL